MSTMMKSFILPRRMAPRPPRPCLPTRHLRLSLLRATPPDNDPPKQDEEEQPPPPTTTSSSSDPPPPPPPPPRHSPRLPPRKPTHLDSPPRRVMGDMQLRLALSLMIADGIANGSVGILAAIGFNWSASHFGGYFDPVPPISLWPSSTLPSFHVALLEQCMAVVPSYLPMPLVVGVACAIPVVLVDALILLPKWKNIGGGGGGDVVKGGVLRIMEGIERELIQEGGGKVTSTATTATSPPPATLPLPTPLPLPPPTPPPTPVTAASVFSSTYTTRRILLEAFRFAQNRQSLNSPSALLSNSQQFFVLLTTVTGRTLRELITWQILLYLTIRYVLDSEADLLTNVETGVLMSSEVMERASALALGVVVLSDAIVKGGAGLRTIVRMEEMMGAMLNRNGKGEGGSGGEGEGGGEASLSSSTAPKPIAKKRVTVEQLYPPTRPSIPSIPTTTPPTPTPPPPSTAPPPSKSPTEREVLSFLLDPPPSSSSSSSTPPPPPPPPGDASRVFASFVLKRTAVYEILMTIRSLISRYAVLAPFLLTGSMWSSWIMGVTAASLITVMEQRSVQASTLEQRERTRSMKKALESARSMQRAQSLVQRVQRAAVGLGDAGVVRAGMPVVVRSRMRAASEATLLALLKKSDDVEVEGKEGGATSSLSPPSSSSSSSSPVSRRLVVTPSELSRAVQLVREKSEAGSRALDAVTSALQRADTKKKQRDQSSAKGDDVGGEATNADASSLSSSSSPPPPLSPALPPPLSPLVAAGNLIIVDLQKEGVSTQTESLVLKMLSSSLVTIFDRIEGMQQASEALLLTIQEDVLSNDSPADLIDRIEAEQVRDEAIQLVDSCRSLRHRAGEMRSMLEERAAAAAALVAASEAAASATEMDKDKTREAVTPLP